MSKSKCTIFPYTGVTFTLAILGSPKNSQDPIALNKAKSAYQACVKTPDYDYYDLPEISIIEEFGGMPLVTNEKVDKVSFSEIAKIAGTFGIPQLFQFTVRNSNPDFYLLIVRFCLTIRRKLKCSLDVSR